MSHRGSQSLNKTLRLYANCVPSHGKLITITKRRTPKRKKNRLPKVQVSCSIASCATRKRTAPPSRDSRAYPTRAPIPLNQVLKFSIAIILCCWLVQKSPNDTEATTHIMRWPYQSPVRRRQFIGILILFSFDLSLALSHTHTNTSRILLVMLLLFGVVDLRKQNESNNNSCWKFDAK